MVTKIWLRVMPVPETIRTLAAFFPSPEAAGEAVSANWFDVAREFTERWHHQQQIRLAIGGPADADLDTW